MALARCDLGRDAMARRPPDVVGGCAQLEEARDLLRGRGALGLRGLGGSPSAPRLLEAVEMTLGEMKPRQTIERLALPLSDDHATTRMLGSRALRERSRPGTMHLRGGRGTVASSGPLSLTCGGRSVSSTRGPAH